MSRQGLNILSGHISNVALELFSRFSHCISIIVDIFFHGEIIRIEQWTIKRIFRRQSNFTRLRIEPHRISGTEKNEICLVELHPKSKTKSRQINKMYKFSQNGKQKIISKPHLAEKQNFWIEPVPIRFDPTPELSRDFWGEEHIRRTEIHIETTSEYVFKFQLKFQYFLPFAHDQLLPMVRYGAACRGTEWMELSLKVETFVNIICCLRIKNGFENKYMWKYLRRKYM